MRNTALMCLLACACGTQPSNDPEQQLPHREAPHGSQAVPSTIALGVNTAKCMDVRAASTANGTAVQIYDCNGTPAQEFSYSAGAVSVLGGKCLDVTGGSTANGTKLQIWDCAAGNKNQAWAFNGAQLVWSGGGGSKCVDLSGGSQGNGTQLQLWDCDASNKNQQWAYCFMADGNSPTVPVTPPTTAPSSGLTVAPYFESWAFGDSGYSVTSFTDAAAKTGLKAATFAFEISGGGCKASSDIQGALGDIKSFIAKGGKLIVSFGGAAGPFLEGTCTDAGQIASAIDGVLTAAGTHMVDFDMEGSALDDAGANARRVTALKQLQAKYADLYTSFTLPVDANGGLPGDAITLLKNLKAGGVRVDVVNIMAMDYGYVNAGKTYGDMAISATDETAAQLASLYGISQADAYKRIGITPMIGKNDDGNVFSVPSAVQLATYARSKQVPLLSFWSIQRDRAGGSDYNEYSLAQSSDFAFTKALQAAQQ